MNFLKERGLVQNDKLVKASFTGDVIGGNCYLGRVGGNSASDKKVVLVKGGKVIRFDKLLLGMKLTTDEGVKLTINGDHLTKNGNEHDWKEPVGSLTIEEGSGDAGEVNVEQKIAEGDDLLSFRGNLYNIEDLNNPVTFSCDTGIKLRFGGEFYEAKKRLLQKEPRGYEDWQPVRNAIKNIARNLQPQGWQMLGGKFLVQTENVQSAAESIAVDNMTIRYNGENMKPQPVQKFGDISVFEFETDDGATLRILNQEFKVAKPFSRYKPSPEEDKLGTAFEDYFPGSSLTAKFDFVSLMELVAGK